MSRRKGLVNWGKQLTDKVPDKPPAFGGEQKLAQSVMGGTLSNSALGGLATSNESSHSIITDGSASLLPAATRFQANLQIHEDKKNTFS